MQDYGEACGTMRTVLREILAKRKAEHPEAIVEDVIGALHNQETAWCLYLIADRAYTNH